jgi:hypothetical protein
MTFNIDSLDAELSRLSTSEAKLDFISRWAHASHAVDSTTPSVFLSSHGTARGSIDTLSHFDPEVPAFSEILDKHGISSEEYMRYVMQGGMGSRDYVLDVLPCAHVDPGRAWKCLNAGSLTCGNCKIVKYCSKVSAAMDVRAAYLSFK